MTTSDIDLDRNDEFTIGEMRVEVFDPRAFSIVKELLSELVAGVIGPQSFFKACQRVGEDTDSILECFPPLFQFRTYLGLESG